LCLNHTFLTPQKTVEASFPEAVPVFGAVFQDIIIDKVSLRVAKSSRKQALKCFNGI
jgi:hypothetical protein